MLLPAFVFGISLVLCCVFLAFIEFDTQRTLVVTPRSSWSDPKFRRQLPNVLAVLQNAGMSSPWPAKVTGSSIWWFQHKLRRLLGGNSQSVHGLADWYVGIWLGLHDLMPLLELGFCKTRGDLAMQLCRTDIWAGHERPLALLRDCRERQHSLLADAQRQFGDDCVDQAQHLLAELRRIEIVFNEHGFHVHEEFAPLKQMEQALAATPDCDDFAPESPSMGGFSGSIKR